MFRLSLDHIPHVLLGAYLLLCGVLAVHPYDRMTWFVAKLTMWILVVGLVWLYVGQVRFSLTAYLLMSILIFLHTIGGHYSFERVPFGIVTEFFGFERNHFDRIAHFSVGFYAYALAEWLTSVRRVTDRLIVLVFPVCIIATVAMSYELVEWIYAAQSSPELGALYLGSQGDIWDAQKDMLADTLGAIVAMVFFAWRTRTPHLSS